MMDDTTILVYIPFSLITFCYALHRYLQPIVRHSMPKMSFITVILKMNRVIVMPKMNHVTVMLKMEYVTLCC